MSICFFWYLSLLASPQQVMCPHQGVPSGEPFFFLQIPNRCVYGVLHSSAPSSAVANDGSRLMFDVDILRPSPPFSIALPSNFPIQKCIFVAVVFGPRVRRSNLLLLLSPHPAVSIPPTELMEVRRSYFFMPPCHFC